MDTLALRDIHLPAQPGLWPLAWGWWLVFCLIVLLGIVLWWWLRRYRQQRPFRLAKLALNEILFSPLLMPHEKQIALSQWLRQVAILSSGREQVASLTGPVWQNYLDHGLADQPFSQGLGRLLCHAYSAVPVADWDNEALYGLCLRWLKHQAKRGRANV